MKKVNIPGSLIIKSFLLNYVSAFSEHIVKDYKLSFLQLKKFNAKPIGTLLLILFLVDDRVW
jgi:hypothetical protein